MRSNVNNTIVEIRIMRDKGDEGLGTKMNVKIDQVDCRPLKIQDLLTNTGIILQYIILYRYLYIGTPTLLILLLYLYSTSSYDVMISSKI